MRRALALALCALAGAPAARAACPAVPDPPPALSPASAREIDGYVRAVARASPVISTGVAGLSTQGRPLRYAIASALPPDRLRAAMARLRAVRTGRAHSAGDAPAVVWVAGTVHGNEPAGGDADLRLLRDLAGLCHDPLLRRVVVVVLPDQNPDGRGMRTRVNFNGFDLNRDWLALTQPESQARLRLALAMPPLAYVDQHEQGGPGFFAPPYSPPFFHELPEAALAAERDVVGPAVRAAFQRKGYPSGSDGTFDLLYPGYGDSATTLLFGAVGMTFESGVASPYVRRVGEQLAAAHAVLRSVARHRAALMTAWAESFAQARQQGARGLLQHLDRPRVYGYALGAGAEPLVAQLMAEGVAVGRLAADTPVASLRPYGSAAPGAPATLPAGTYLVSAAQPLKHWIEALLGQSPEAGGPSTSDVNAWSRPLLMGLPGGTLGAPPPAAPAAAVPAPAAAQPLAGRRLALLGDPARVRVGRPRRRAAQRRHELGALRPRPPRRAGRRGRRRAPWPPARSRDTMPSWWPTARRPRSRPRRCTAVSAFVAGGGTFVGWRARGIAVAGAAGLTQATVTASGPATWIPGAAVAVGAAWSSTTTTRSSSAGTSRRPTARCSAAGRWARRPGARRSSTSASARAAPCSSPSIPSSARRARAPQALLTTALTGATPGAR